MAALWTLGFVCTLIWVLPIGIAHGIGQRRNRAGWVYGLLLGWLGVLILSLTQPLPSEAELQIRQLDAQHRLDEMRRIAS